MFFVVYCYFEILFVLCIVMLCMYVLLCKYGYSQLYFCVCGHMYIALVRKNGVCRAPELKLLINQSINSY